MIDTIRAIRKDQTGTAFMELAFVVPILVLLTLAASDIAMGFSAKLKLQTAAERAAEMATSGGLSSAAYQNLQADAADAAGVPASNVTVTSTLQCDGVEQSSTSNICPTGQQISRYVRIDISGTYQPMFGGAIINNLWSSSQTIAISGAASVRLQ